ncbi:MAG: NlpC/P60 family protein [Gemmatimonadetes bacterium]|nr:NlpC/P60 family protein [Gemmatimonadota bacterium]
MRSLSTTRPTRLAIVLCTAAALCAPVSRASAQSTKPFASFSNSALTLRDSVVQMARAQLGKRYRTGGQAPEKGFDCSGLVRYVLSALNVGLPRTARQQAGVGLALTRDTSELLPGDLLTFGKTKKGVSHVAIYIGEGKYIHASSKAGKVIESSFDRPHSSLVKMWRGARRVLSLDDSASTIVIATSPKPDGQP